MSIENTKIEKSLNIRLCSVRFRLQYSESVFLNGLANLFLPLQISVSFVLNFCLDRFVTFFVICRARVQRLKAKILQFLSMYN